MNTIIRNSYTPKARDYCNKIVVDEDNAVQYIFDSDGTFTVYTPKQQEGATEYYVQSAINAAKDELKIYATKKDSKVLEEAKAYTDEHSDPSAVSKSYVDQQDLETLNSAKAYADGVGSTAENNAKTYTDGAIASSATGSLAEAKAYADQVGVDTLGAANTNISNAIAELDIPVFTLSNVDIGEGQPLAANHFYGVFE